MTGSPGCVESGVPWPGSISRGCLKGVLLFHLREHDLAPDLQRSLLRFFCWDLPESTKPFPTMESCPTTGPMGLSGQQRGFLHPSLAWLLSCLGPHSEMAFHVTCLWDWKSPARR